MAPSKYITYYSFSLLKFKLMLTGLFNFFFLYSDLKMTVMFVTLIEAAFKHHHFLCYNHSNAKWRMASTFCLVVVSATGNL